MIGYPPAEGETKGKDRQEGSEAAEEVKKKDSAEEAILNTRIKCISLT
jgi:hypothetical protein